MNSRKCRIKNSSPLAGCEGIIVGESYDGCYDIEFTKTVNEYFKLPCQQSIAKKHVEILADDTPQPQPQSKWEGVKFNVMLSLTALTALTVIGLALVAAGSLIFGK